MLPPLISTIMPCFNQGRFLPEAIESLRAQTFKRWECVVINDGSSDNTEDIAEQLSVMDDRVRVVSQDNHGLSSARNRGLEEAAGEYIQFLDADDLIECKKYEWQIQLFQKNPDIDVVCSDARYFPTESPEQRRFSISDADVPWVQSVWESTEPLIAKLLQGNVMPVNCPLIKRSTVKRVGQFDENLRALEDWHYWIRCALKGVRFYFAPAEGTLALVRVHCASMTHDNNRMHKAQFNVALKIGRLLGDAGLRKMNFKNGINGLLQTNMSWKAWHMIRLGLANRQTDMIQPILRFYANRHPRLLRLSRRLMQNR